MSLFKVRSEFFVHLDGKTFKPGVALELSDDQFELVAHQVEPADAPEPKPGRKPKDPT
jgi:hypothetical protein